VAVESDCFELFGILHENYIISPSVKLKDWLQLCEELKLVISDGVLVLIN